MSDVSRGPGWWKASDGRWYPPQTDPPQPGWWMASDGRWYPPELHPDYVAPEQPEAAPEPEPRAEPWPEPRAEPGPPRSPESRPRPEEPEPAPVAGRGISPWRWYQQRTLAQKAVLVVCAVLLIAVVLWFGGADEEGRQQPVTNAASATSEPAPSTTMAATTTTTTLPPGEDRTVSRVVDGDSLVVDDGRTIRLIGVNAPEVEFGECFSAEATSHLRQLIEAGTRVRLVYDSERLDVYGRALAYVYRLPDGLFVNLTLVKDGYATQMRVAPNTTHADAIARAEGEARSGNVGLWRSCPAAAAATTTTTTAATQSTRVPLLTTVPATRAALGSVPAGSGCHPSYRGACVPIGPDVDCSDLTARNFRVVGPDEHRLDGSDNDGIACER